MTPEETLTCIRGRLAAGDRPAAVIGQLLPRTRDEAVTWARRLSVWDEFRDRYGARAVGVARVVSRRAMREHRPTLTEDGRVADGRHPARRPQRPSCDFPLPGGEARVEYTADDPEAYAALYAEARLRGREEVFEGARPEVRPGRPPTRRRPPVLGGHTAGAVAPEPPDGPPGRLF